jgi:DNA-binding NarL/FixJ family response regulator
MADAGVIIKADLKEEDLTRKIDKLVQDVDNKFKVLNQITQKDLSKSPNKKSNALNPQTSDSVRQLKRQGWTIDQIAKRLDLTENEVDLILQLPE